MVIEVNFGHETIREVFMWADFENLPMTRDSRNPHHHYHQFPAVDCAAFSSSPTLLLRLRWRLTKKASLSSVEEIGDLFSITSRWRKPYRYWWVLKKHNQRTRAMIVNRHESCLKTFGI